MTTKQNAIFGGAFEQDWRATVLFVTWPVWLPIAMLLGEVYGKDRVMSWVCRQTSHSWADDHRYGVEPECLHCGTKRGEH